MFGALFRQGLTGCPGTHYVEQTSFKQSSASLCP